MECIEGLTEVFERLLIPALRQMIKKYAEEKYNDYSCLLEVFETAMNHKVPWV